MDSRDTQEALETIGTMLSGWINAHSNITAATVRAYLSVVVDCSLESVREACFELGSGKLERNHAFIPSAAELATRARFLDELRKPQPDAEGITTYRIGAVPPDGFSPLGPTVVDFGHGPIAMQKMSAAQKEELLTRKGLPPAVAVPRLQGMR